jgi:hypothetical protein
MSLFNSVTNSFSSSKKLATMAFRNLAGFNLDKSNGWQWFIKSLRGHREFKLFQLLWVAETGAIFESFGSRIAVGIAHGVIHRRG